jgi:Tfp pilus assembly protein PilF
MLDRALESYKLAARYSRGDLRYLEKVADLQERLGQLGEAARTYMAAAELQLRQRELDEAIHNWQRAVRLAPELLGAHRRLAMVFQRQGNTRAAVREYLAIARAQQMRGDEEKALQMCHAALRLDPGNEDVLMAMRLVRQGADAVPEPEPEPQPEVITAEAREQMEMAETVRQIATAFEEERQQWQRPARPRDPLSSAMARAQDQLAEEIFREEDETDEVGWGEDRLTKLERDALIGQGIDFQSRGDASNAIVCYERAVAGGLNMPAAYFLLGVLYLQEGKRRHAKAALTRAGRDPSYRDAIRLVWQGKTVSR